MSQNIFSDEKVSIFKGIKDFDQVFSGFELLMKGGNEKELEDLDDSNINMLLKASKATGDERRCILCDHALNFHQARRRRPACQAGAHVAR